MEQGNLRNQPEIFELPVGPLSPPPGRSASSCQEVFAGGGEMGALMRAFDWAKTPLGPVETWSPTLRVTTRLLLSNCSAMLLWWGPEFIQIYNDAYIPVLGDKHPHVALGRPFAECWSEVFYLLGPLVRTALEGGPPTWMEDIPLDLNRFGFVEETHFTIGYSPVPDETAPGGIGGVLATVHEITEKVLAERRVRVLRDLGTAGPAEAKTAEEACAAAAATLGNHGKDVPFALLYLTESNGRFARLAAHTGIGDCAALGPDLVEISESGDSVWPFAAAKELQEIVVIYDLQRRFDHLPSGPWFDPPHSAAVVPIRSNISHQLAGFLVAGISPRLRLDDSYRGFLELASAQIATTIANARAYEEERRRNDALAEIDHAKTIFFTNISHEFRTPLTLMMAPLEDALAQPDQIPASQRVGLELAYRNSLRLLKLVNTLLDFSRIEAGRMQAVFEPLDLATLTADLASLFRSTMERAGLKLTVDCPSLREPVYVDREKWEKIVLNLLSNAFKFTLEGSIEVSLGEAGDAAELTVRDTGCGISAEDLPHVFERFYRAGHAQSRSYEGSGIGLALVQDLVRLNGGTVSVESRPGRGSTFRVSVPFGSAHLPADRIGATRAPAATAISSVAYLEEALHWLPAMGDAGAAPAAGPGSPESIPGSSPASSPGSSPGLRQRERIVLAEDNSDMREYVQRLLAPAYRVESVGDGQAGLEAVLRDPPDLVLADVMMPRLDGFGLVKALRSSERTASIPVILLSARAGEESRVEGVSAGADDYLVKPFSARELTARVENLLALSRIRRETEQRIRESEERFRAFVEASSDVIYRMNADWSEMRQLRGRDFIADAEAPSGSWLEEYIHPDDHRLVLDAIQKAIREKSVFELEHRVMRLDGTPGWTFSRAVPLFDASGKIVEWFGAATDITARKQSEQALLRSEKLATLGRMAATIAHEINNPLESVTNLLFLADEEENLPASAHHYLQMAEVELRRIAHITRQSLGFYRESNAPALTSVNAVLDSAIDLLKSKIDQKRATVERDWRSDVHIVAVAGELRQVFSNLLTNSLDAIDFNGKIRIRISTHASAEDAAARMVRITFLDDGRGISPAARSHIFEPFFTTKGTVGTGLGLWVTKQIVEKHAGAIRLRSRSEGAKTGTVFSIVLPFETESAGDGN
jgi:signal transduction histidine kinase/DNA-binding NarL/FixJ family response regulator